MTVTIYYSIQEGVLRELVRAQADLRIRVVGRGDAPGFKIEAHYGISRCTLEGTRKAPRTFATLDAAANCIKELGVSTFEVDVAKHQQGRLRPPRQDRADAMRMANLQVAKTRAKTSKK